MEKLKLRKVRSIKEEEDFISKLPDVLLSSIISLLPFYEGVRTSVLSKRWETVWKYSSHLNFDQRNMLKPLIDEYMKNSDPTRRLKMAMCRKASPEDEQYFDIISQAAMLITSIIDNHIGPLKSCSIRHLVESIPSGDVVGWMRKLLAKEVTEVSMELESFEHYYRLINIDRDLMDAEYAINIPFEVFSNFKVLKLKNYKFKTTNFSTSSQVLQTLTLDRLNITLNNFQDILSHCSCLENLILSRCDSIGVNVKIDSSSLKYFKIYDMIVQNLLISAINVEIVEIDSIIYNIGEIIFETPKLQVLHVYMEKSENFLSLYGNKLLRTRDITQRYRALGSRGSSMESIFQNLVTLSLDLDLEKSINLIGLYSALKFCHKLMNLQINNKVNLGRENETYDQNTNDSMSYGEYMFWQKMEPCKCINNQLKSVRIKGYKGGKIEYEFVKYLITNSQVIEKIILWFVDDCSWVEVVATICLLSYPKVSSKLSIDLKPGVEYKKKYGDNFEKWVTTLK